MFLTCQLYLRIYPNDSQLAWIPLKTYCDLQYVNMVSVVTISHEFMHAQSVAI